MRLTAGLSLAGAVALTLTVATVIKQHRDGDPVLGSPVRHERTVLAELAEAEAQSAKPPAASTVQRKH